MSGLEQRLSVVILSYNRGPELLRTLRHMRGLAERPAIVVVDNASTDATVALLAQHYPDVELISLKRNMGAAARNIAVQHVQTPYVAFCDDDSWWEAGSLAMSVDILDRYPAVAALCGRVLLGEAQTEDPICSVLAASPLPSDGMPGRALLGFIACAVVFRRHAYLTAGGYEEKFLVGGEEELLTLDLVAAGWCIVYQPRLTVHHYPSPLRDRTARQKIIMRNALWVAWLRLPVAGAWAETLRICRAAPSPQVLKAALFSALKELPWICRKRRILPVDVQKLFQKLRAE